MSTTCAPYSQQSLPIGGEGGASAWVGGEGEGTGWLGGDATGASGEGGGEWESAGTLPAGGDGKAAGGLMTGRAGGAADQASLGKGKGRLHMLTRGWQGEERAQAERRAGGCYGNACLGQGVAASTHMAPQQGCWPGAALNLWAAKAAPAQQLDLGREPGSRSQPGTAGAGAAGCPLAAEPAGRLAGWLVAVWQVAEAPGPHSQAEGPPLGVGMPWGCSARQPRALAARRSVPLATCPARARGRAWPGGEGLAAPRPAGPRMA